MCRLSWLLLTLVTFSALIAEERTQSFVVALPQLQKNIVSNQVPLSNRFKRQDEAPVEEAPVEEAPVEEVPAEEVPVEEAPAEEAPLEEVPAEEVPAEEAPVDEAIVEEVPVEEAPVEEVSVEEAPVEEAPAEEAPAEEVPVEEAPIVDEAPVEEAPVEEVPVEETLVEETLAVEEVIEETEDFPDSDAVAGEVEPEYVDENDEDVDAIEGILGLEDGSGFEPAEETEGSGDLQAEEEDNKAVLEAPPIEDVSTTSAPLHACASTTFGCCSTNNTLPSHGPREEGCCLSSEFGCCPDMITSAAGPEQEGCFCTETDFGCCPDGVTAARGPDNAGCGCLHSPFGCCPDQVTSSPGPDLEGCPCHTSEFGCCPDGQTNAQGPNLEGCSDCSTSEHGCCPDQFTPAAGPDAQGCECAGSEHGCCPDGLTMATGADFEGCNEIPGEYCHLPKSTGSCRENFTVKWFFDMNYGGCSRFWYSDCGDEKTGNGNRFDDEMSCEDHCVKPAGSGRCYLPKVTGPCKGLMQRWYFDRKWNKCMEFTYGGCLGNMNNFETQQQCQESCLRTPENEVAVCAQPYEPGPCRGTYERWYYDGTDGLCKTMNYTGCLGNANRFMTKEECDNSCKHESKLVRARTVCSLPKHVGRYCKDELVNLAKWYFDNRSKKCKPFYFYGCGGNENRFDSWEECEQGCPNTFPPEIDLQGKVLVIEEGFPALLSAFVEANPSPTVTWKFDDNDVVIDERITQLENGSLNIATAEMTDSGTWTIIADNGLGQVARKQVVLNVHPSRMPIEVVIGKDKTLYKQGEEIKLTCSVKGYPIPVIKWYKNNTPLPKVNRIQVYDDNTLTLTETSTIDGGSYTCRATNQHESVSDRVSLKVEKAEEVKKCVDNPKFARCDLIVKAKYCNKNAYYADFCCASCTAAGQLGPETQDNDSAEEENDETVEETEAKEEETVTEEPVQEETATEYEYESDNGEVAQDLEEPEYESEDGEVVQDLEEPEYESEDGEVAQDLEEPEYESEDGEVVEDLEEPEYETEVAEEAPAEE